MVALQKKHRSDRKVNILQKLAIKILKITPSTNRTIKIKEPLSFEANVIKNQIWYRADPVEIEQFFKAIAKYDVEKARFWAACPQDQIRKTHSGIVQIVIDRLSDIVLSDMNEVDFGEETEEKPVLELWQKIAADNEFNTLLDEALTGVLSSGDGAFKISVEPELKYPVIEFYTADNVEYVRKRGRLVEILYYTSYYKDNKEYRLKETYGKGYINYQLYDDVGKEVDISIIEEIADLQDTTFDGDFIMGVPFIIFSSNKWKGRGKALFDSKTDNLDGLDEILSQWLDAVRLGRVKRYIPEDLIPRNADDGTLMRPNPFDNAFIATGSVMSEDGTGKIDVSQPIISYEAYVNSYISWMDLCLQGIISPATLGIDLKKTDNAESQREKEKITIHTRQKITYVLDKVIPALAVATLQVYDLMQNKAPNTYIASVVFGEYGAPGFENVVETVTKAKAGQVMSIETCIEEMYGDTRDKDWKAEEVKRIKEEMGIAEIDELTLIDNAGVEDE